jgi:phosphatidylinositol N-acetylglucosaminyltransferase subunit C
MSINMLILLDPDNYTDASTFLDHLQRNQNFQPYQFWRLVADSTVIVQQVCSVAIFVCCFIGIFQERVSPVTIVGCGSAGTVLGWIAWDLWVGQEESLAAKRREEAVAAASSASLSIESEDATSAADSSTTASDAPLEEVLADEFHPPPQVFGDPLSSLSPRNQQRLATIKSAALIYCAVLGMSPILKSLTKSTTSDSIWAVSCWLMVINLFFFDYGGGVGAK